MKLRYFAWVRERMGREAEEIEQPAGVATVAELMAWLAARDEQGAHAFEHSGVIRAAIDQHHVAHDAPVEGAGEIAFFPPMTGG
ncbi:MAG: molybdopterin converting factor subunit 1 [Flavobacteriaceae bacterium]